MKIRPVGAELFHAEQNGRTDMMKRRVAFHNSAKETKNPTQNLMENLAVLEWFHTDMCLTATG
jgi:hypothetical protein